MVSLDEKTLARFWSKVNKNGPIPAHRPELGPCHEWTAHRDPKGYGRFHFGKRNETHLAHRVAFLIDTGSWPIAHRLHHCDNPACVRISHMFDGDQLANMADRDAKGRVAHGATHYAAKLTSAEVEEIRSAVANGERRLIVGQRFGVSRGTVGDIVCFRRRRHG